MGRKKQDPENSAKRAQILKTAGRLFIERGYDAVSMDAIAEAAPVSKPTLYNHFRDKSALFTAVLQARCQKLFEAFEKSTAEATDVREALVLTGMAFLDVILAPEALSIHRIMIAESQKFPELGKNFYESGPRRSREMLAAWLAAQDRAGKLRVINPEASASLFLSMMRGHVHMQCLLGVRKNISRKERAEIVEHGVDVFLKGHERE
jgi:TetR/AcrR family transcriptional repressor of mexJK operon